MTVTRWRLNKKQMSACKHIQEDPVSIDTVPLLAHIKSSETLFFNKKIRYHPKLD